MKTVLYAKRRELKSLIKQARKGQMTPIIDRYKMELQVIESELASPTKPQNSSPRIQAS